MADAKYTPRLKTLYQTKYAAELKDELKLYRGKGSGIV